MDHSIHRSGRGGAGYGLTIFTISAALLLSPFAAADAGLGDLIERIGKENIPTGQNVEVGQVEAPDGSGDYAPDQNNSEFDGKTFQLMSGPSGNSGHATIVGRNFYGLDTSIAPGITFIRCYEANGFLTSDYLRVNLGPGSQPLPTPGEMTVLNHSWVGNAGGFNDEILRRADFLVQRDGVMMVAGVNDSPPHFALLSHMFNGIAVGKIGGGHAAGDTIDGIDVPGRMIPHIVAPGSATSWATAVASAAVSLLVETARTDEALKGNPEGEAPAVIRAALLAGGKHGEGWTNNPETDGPNRGATDRPLDEEFGAGSVDVNRAHLILTGGQQPGASSAAGATLADHAGWDHVEVETGGSRYWRFEVAKVADEVSILATWNRWVSPSNMNTWNVAAFELELWGLDDSNEMFSLIGPGGEAIFEGGNVLSNSEVDTIQHLFITGLSPGEYLLELRRTDGLAEPRAAAVAWLLPETETDTVPGDLNGDGSVGVPDLIILINSWGACDTCDDCPADLTGDCTVGVPDLLVLINNWG